MTGLSRILRHAGLLPTPALDPTDVARSKVRRSARVAVRAVVARDQSNAAAGRARRQLDAANETIATLRAELAAARRAEFTAGMNLAATRDDLARWRQIAEVAHRESAARGDQLRARGVAPAVMDARTGDAMPPTGLTDADDVYSTVGADL